MIKKIKNIVHRHILIVILKAKKLLEHFPKKNGKNKSKNLRSKKVIKKQCRKLYVKW